METEAVGYFPLGIAEGGAFCNRVEEKKQLKQNVKARQHSILISPRRYGKTSLVYSVADELQLPFAVVDLFVAIDANTVQEQLILGIKQLINKVVSTPEQAIHWLKDYFKSLKSRWIIGTDGVSIELTPQSNSDPALTILEILQALEEILQKKQQQAILFIDEFQEIAKLQQSRGIEGAIRHVAQKAKYLNLIFSGSNRHLLASIFDDRNRPLYMLCKRINIERINAQHYRQHINHIAKITWGKEFAEDILELILKISECHPYYVNLLCNLIWSSHPTKMPELNEIQEIWHNYIILEKTKTIRDISHLNISQLKIMIAIAHGEQNNLTGKLALAKFNFSSATIVKSLRQLQQEDYVVQSSTGQYSILDPLIRDSLLFFYPKGH